MRSAVDLALASIAIWFGACTHTAGPPRVQLTPLTAGGDVEAGSAARLAVRVMLPEGFHVNASRPRDPSLIPTVLTVDLPAGVSVAEIVYPTPTDLEQRGAPGTLAVYEHEFRIGVVLHVAKDVTPGEMVVPARLRYQACDERSCYIPGTAFTSWTLRVLPAEERGSSIPIGTRPLTRGAGSWQRPA